MTSTSRDYEISHSTIQLELNSILLNDESLIKTCKCLLAIQPFSLLSSIDLLLGSSQFMSGEIGAGNREGTTGHDSSSSLNNRVKSVQFITGLGSSLSQSISIEHWSLDHSTNILHVPLPSSQSSSKQFHIVIWYELMNTNIMSSLTSENEVLGAPSTPILLLDQHNMLNWFPCVIEDKYPMDWIISIPSHCSVTSRKLLAICAGDLQGRYHFICGMQASKQAFFSIY